MNKDLVYDNICDMVNNGYFLNKYIELTSDYAYTELTDEVVKYLEDVSSRIFNAIVIGCQLFDDEELINRFVNFSVYSLDEYSIETFLRVNNIDEEVALDRLKHGFGLHFTTPKICEEIIKNGSLSGFGKNSMFTKEEDEIIKNASLEQQSKNPDSSNTMRYLFRGWGTGVSSYGSITNGFWMYHTPESLSFLFGDISKRDKDSSMRYVLECISSLDEENKKITYDTMSKLWDRLVGDEQSVCCVLIDRDSFEYEVDYYYFNSTPSPVERRPFTHGFNDIFNNDMKISNDIDIKNLRFVKVPTIRQLEILKKQELDNSKHI